MLSYPSTPRTPMAQPYTSLPPMLGWQWQMSNGGAAFTRGISLDLTLKRATEALHLSTGQQQPREIFAGPMEADGSVPFFKNPVSSPTRTASGSPSRSTT